MLQMDREKKSLRHVAMVVWMTTSCESRINADRFSKRAPKVQASRGILGIAPP